MALKNDGAPGLNYKEFRSRIGLETFNPAQAAMINMRLGLLESFMYFENSSGQVATTKPKFESSKNGKLAEKEWEGEQDAKRRARMGNAEIWSFEPGSVTIVDLSDPMVNEGTACGIFDICLALFLEGRANAGRIVALDEAHKV